MRALLLALAISLCSAANSSAQPVTGVDIVQYGIYVADKVREVPTPDGLHYSIVENICHVATTSVVPLKRRVSFGFRYRPDGERRGVVVELKRVTVYPRPTMVRGAKSPVSKVEYPVKRRVGALSYAGYSITSGSTNNLGDWSLEIWQGERLLAAKAFEVVPDDGSPLPESSDSSCFRVS